MEMNQIKSHIKSFGNFNGFHCRVCFFFTKKQVKSMKPYGITEDTTLGEALNLLSLDN